MKKILSALALAALVIPFNAGAKESKAGGVEISGNVDVLAGWQHDDKNAQGIILGGQLGLSRNENTAPKHDTFNFYVDQVEVDLNKSFGENVRLRADLDFGRNASGSARNTDGGSVGLEQAYVTVNLPLGKGAELLVGRFNAPIGYYVVDRNDNPTISFSNIYNFVTPTNVTGAKLYYNFTDNIDFNLYVVNNLRDSISNDSAVPSYGMRLGYNWGEEGNKSTIGLSYAGGPERANHNAHLTHILDLDWSWKVNPQFTLSGEGVYRQDNVTTYGPKNDKVWGAMLVADYKLSDPWRVFFRYGFLQDLKGTYSIAARTGDGILTSASATYNKGFNVHDFALGVGYQITEGAKLKLEYSPTIFDSRNSGVKTSWSHGAAVEFAYNF